MVELLSAVVAKIIIEKLAGVSPSRATLNVAIIIMCSQLFKTSGFEVYRSRKLSNYLN
jgi:hypothetical protein